MKVLTPVCPSSKCWNKYCGFAEPEVIFIIVVKETGTWDNGRRYFSIPTDPTTILHPHIRTLGHAESAIITSPYYCKCGRPILQTHVKSVSITTLHYITLTQQVTNRESRFVNNKTWNIRCGEVGAVTRVVDARIERKLPTVSVQSECNIFYVEIQTVRHVDKQERLTVRHFRVHQASMSPTAAGRHTALCAVQSPLDINLYKYYRCMFKLNVSDRQRSFASNKMQLKLTKESRRTQWCWLIIKFYVDQNMLHVY